MSLLDDGPHEALVWPEVPGEDGDGNRVMRPGSTPVSVRGLAQPVAATEDETSGQQTSTTYRFMCRSFPAGPWARVRVLDADWDVVGEPARRGASEATAHVTVQLKAREPLGVT